MKKPSLRLLSHIVVAYMLLAFTWWSILLYTKNKDAFQAKADYMKIIMVAEHRVHNDVEFKATPEFKALQKEYNRQEWMILGEAAVFVLSLVVAIYFINRGYNKELKTAQQQRNFLLSITHELKSPLASIKLVLETFQKRLLKREQVEKLSATAIKESDRLNNLVNDLLLAAKIETAYEPVYERINLNEKITNLIAGVKMKFPEASISFNERQNPVIFMGDKLGMTSVILNLLENAIKYSPKPAHIKVSLNQQGKNVLMEFADQGIGVVEDEKKKIFEKFYRIGNEDTRETKGTGLGLFIVGEIIKAHQGKIEILDNQPQGTIFRISLPNQISKMVPETLSSQSVN